jgi:hypothetical protein
LSLYILGEIEKSLQKGKDSTPLLQFSILGAKYAAKKDQNQDSGNKNRQNNTHDLSLVPDLILPALLEENFLLVSGRVQGVHAHACSVTKQRSF